MAVLRARRTQFRDPIIWMILDVFTSGIADIVAYCLLDGDLVDARPRRGRDRGTSCPTSTAGSAHRSHAPDPGRLKEPAQLRRRASSPTIVTCGIYGFWWLYDIMVDGNRHFEHNWRWEDGLGGVGAVPCCRCDRSAA